MIALVLTERGALARSFGPSVPRFALALSILLLISAPVVAEDRFTVTMHGNVSFAEQQLTEERIARINEVFGTGVDSGDAISSRGVGIRLLHRVSSRWAAGVQLGYSKSSIDRRALYTPPFDPPTEHELVVREDSWVADVQMVVRASLCRACSFLQPFALASAGAGYADASVFFSANPTTPHVTFNHLRGGHSGWFPVGGIALGLNVALDRRARWLLDLGVGQRWGRLRNDVTPEGLLRFPGEQPDSLRLQTSITGPLVWVGVSRAF